MIIYDYLIKNKDKLLLSIKRDFDKHPAIKFIAIVTLISLYFLFAVRSYGVKDGFIVSIITWSFFVLCTPIADAGILIDFPARLITGIKMIYSEIMVWIIAISINLFMVFNNPDIYNKTILLSLFKHIINQPFPYWGIIILSALGTFLSIYIADSLVDAKNRRSKHLNILVKYKIIILIILVFLIIILYNFLLHKLGIEIPFV